MTDHDLCECELERLAILVEDGKMEPGPAEALVRESRQGGRSTWYEREWLCDSCPMREAKP